MFRALVSMTRQKKHSDILDLRTGTSLDPCGLSSHGGPPTPLQGFILAVLIQKRHARYRSATPQSEPLFH